MPKNPSKKSEVPGVEMRAVASLVPYARNARTHSDEQVARIAASIREFGWTNPVLVDGANGIIAGHGRVLAARKLGQAEVPCIELAHLTEAQKRAYILADNRLALDAGWDEELLALEFGELKALDFDLSLTGFGDDEIAKTLGEATNELLDGAPALSPGTTFSVIVDFDNETAQGELLGRLEAEGYKCRLLIS